MFAVALKATTTKKEIVGVFSVSGVGSQLISHTHPPKIIVAKKGKKKARVSTNPKLNPARVVTTSPKPQRNRRT